MAAVNPWLAAAGVLMVCVGLCVFACLRGETMSRLAAYELAGLIAILTTMLLAHGYARPSIYDLALALALLSYPTGIVFAHFMQRWL